MIKPVSDERDFDTNPESQERPEPQLTVHSGSQWKFKYRSWCGHFDEFLDKPVLYCWESAKYCRYDSDGWAIHSRCATHFEADVHHADRRYYEKV